MDWGFGHTTRSLVLLRLLIEQNNQLYIAGNSQQISFYEKENLPATYFNIEGYNIHFSGKINGYFQILQQLKKFNVTISKEKDFVHEIIHSYDIDIILSDNRYGFYHPDRLSIILTHQLNLQVPKFRKLANKKLEKWLNPFQHIWVPDYSDHRLTGELSQNKKFNNVEYINPLCRFYKLNLPTNYNHCLLLTGPNPARNEFLQLALSKLPRTSSLCIVSPEPLDKAYSEIKNFIAPTTKELNEILCSSNIIVSLAGYTTIMELDQLKKKAFITPTPNQYEQVYLAQNLKHPRIKSF